MTPFSHLVISTLSIRTHLLVFQCALSYIDAPFHTLLPLSRVGGGKKYRTLEAQAQAQAKFAHAQGLARASKGGPGGGGGGGGDVDRSNPLNLIRRAATPGGALESDSRFTGKTHAHSLTRTL